MRLDDYLSTVGLIRRRTVAKQMGDNGLFEVNGRRVKPAHQVQVNDIIQIKGSHPQTVEVLAIPAASVRKQDRDQYFRELSARPS